MLPKYEFSYGGQMLVALPQRALWWPSHHILLIADLHLGKATHMQAAGLYIPTGVAKNDLRRLDNLIQSYLPQTVIILGDLFHSKTNAEWELLKAWKNAQLCAVELIRGNHDRFISDSDFRNIGIGVHQQFLQISKITLSHHPRASGDSFNIAGHVHPTYTLRAPGDALRLPCFWTSHTKIVLPAFTDFSGGYSINRKPFLKAICTQADPPSLILVEKPLPMASA